MSERVQVVGVGVERKVTEDVHRGHLSFFPQPDVLQALSTNNELDWEAAERGIITVPVRDAEHKKTAFNGLRSEEIE